MGRYKFDPIERRSWIAKNPEDGPRMRRFPRIWSFKNMMWQAKLKMLGKHHSGIDDAKNLARAAQYLVDRHFVFNNDMIYNYERDNDPLF